MKSFMISCLLFVAIAISAVAGVEVKVLTDTSWPMLAAHVKAGDMTQEQASEAQKAIVVADKSAHEANNAGDYSKAAELTPFSHARCWYELSKLRVLLGGTKNGDGYWEKYNAKCTLINEETDTWECHFNGSAIEKAACIAQAKLVIEIADEADKLGLYTPSDGPNAPSKAKAAAQNYLDTLLK